MHELSVKLSIADKRHLVQMTKMNYLYWFYAGF